MRIKFAALLLAAITFAPFAAPLTAPAALAQSGVQSTRARRIFTSATDPTPSACVIGDKWIDTSTDPAVEKTCLTAGLWSVGTGSGIAAGSFTENRLAKIVDATGKVVGNSNAADDGSMMTYTGEGGISAPKLAVTGGGGGLLGLTEGTEPDGVVGEAILYGDASLHRIKVKHNNASPDTLAVYNDQLSVFAATNSSGLASVLTDETGTAGGFARATAPTFTNAASTVQALTDGATISWNANSGDMATVTLGGNRTIAAPTNIRAGGNYILALTQDATGSRTVTWNSVFKWVGGTAPTLTTTASRTDLIRCTTLNGTDLLCNAHLNFASAGGGGGGGGGGGEASPQTRYPFADSSTQNGWAALGGGFKYSEVDETVADDATSYIHATNSSPLNQLFTPENNFAVPAGATSISLTVNFRCQRTGSAVDVLGRLLMSNGLSYVGTAKALTTSWANYSETWATNPATSAAWTVDQINGVGTNALSEWGVRGQAIAAGESAQCTQVNAVVTFTAP